MKNKARRMALFLAFTLILVVFAGCAPSDQGSTPATTQSSATTQTSASTDTSTSELNFKGVKIKALCYESEAKDNELVQKAINDKLGFEIEWVVCPASEGWAALDRLLAADPTIDMMYMGLARLSTYVSKGYVMDISGYVGDTRFPNVQELSLSHLEGTAAADGKYYAFPLIAPGSYATTNGFALAIREDWLKETGLSAPKTIDDVDKILAAFKAKDPSKYPMTAEDLSCFTTLFARAFSVGGSGWWKDTDGTLKHPIQAPGFKDYVAKMAEWYSKGYLHPEFVTATTQSTTQLMSSGEVGFVPAWCTNAINPNVALMEQDPNARFMLMAETVTGPAGGGVLGGSNVTSFLALNKNTKNADACLAAFDFFLTEEGSRLVNWGIEGTNYTAFDGKVVRATGEHAYNGLCNPYGYQPWTMNLQTGNHYTDTQFVNWHKVFYAPERLAQRYFEPDTGLLYDYSTGENQYSTLKTTADTYIKEMLINMITGKEKLDNWDAKVKELEGIALNQMVKERNEQWVKYGKKEFVAGAPLLDVTKGMPEWMESFVW